MYNVYRKDISNRIFCCLQPFKKFKFGPLLLGVLFKKKVHQFLLWFLYIKLHDICLTLTRASSPQKCFYFMILFKYKVTWYILVHFKMLFVNQKWTQFWNWVTIMVGFILWFPVLFTKCLFIPLYKAIGCLSVVCLSVFLIYHIQIFRVVALWSTDNKKNIFFHLALPPPE